MIILVKLLQYYKYIYFKIIGFIQLIELAAGLFIAKLNSSYFTIKYYFMLINFH